MPPVVEYRHTIERIQCLNPTADQPTMERWAMRQAYVDDTAVGAAEHVRLVDRPIISFDSPAALLTIVDSDIPTQTQGDEE
jgi:hypothetical protein